MVRKGNMADVEELEISCIECSESLHPTVRELLGQCDVPGMDYEDGGQKYVFIRMHILLLVTSLNLTFICLPIVFSC